MAPAAGSDEDLANKLNQPCLAMPYTLLRAKPIKRSIIPVFSLESLTILTHEATHKPLESAIHK